MKRIILVALAVLLPVLALADWPARPDVSQFASCTRQVVDYVVFIPLAIQTRLASAGYPITPTPGLPYKQLRGRQWTCSYTDGGTVVIPPRLAKLAEYFRPDLTTVTDPACTDPTLCPAGDTTADDGGDNTDPVVESTFACACSNGNVLVDGGATCRYASTGGYDAGNAAVGITLQPGTFQGPGCKPKPCGELWLTQTLADGGTARVDSFPNACPSPN